MTQHLTMSATERRASMALASIMSLRMLGLFMILPVFSLYAAHLEGVTPTLIGIAIGIYGLTQAVLQIPFGMLSDRLGRKPVIAAGLVIFALGSLVAALADSIGWIIVGRILQGAGAISAAIMALTADLTREEHRTKAMAIIGMSIGLSFAFAMVAGPVLNTWIGVPGIFLLIGVLALLSILVLYFGVPQPAHSGFHSDTEPVPAQFKRVLSDGELLRLDIGSFTLHAQLTGMFVIIPLALQDAGLIAAKHWMVYLPVMLLSFLAMVPFIIIAEKRRRLKQIFSAAVLVLVGVQLLLAQFHYHLWAIGLLLFVFFTAFNLLEASMPSLLSKIAPPESKGTAMGAFSTLQFLGAFVGGTGGGWLYQHYGMNAVFLFSAAGSALWFLLAATMRQPRYLTTHLLHVGELDPAQARLLSQRLLEISGVEEAAVIAEEGAAYLKIDKQRIDMDALEEFSV